MCMYFSVCCTERNSNATTSLYTTYHYLTAYSTATTIKFSDTAIENMMAQYANS